MTITIYFTRDLDKMGRFLRKKLHFKNFVTGGHMGVKITGRMVDPITYEMKHESGTLITTTAPKDNGGDGTKFSPTDLCATAYASCVATIMGLYAKNHDIKIDALDFSVEKVMSSNPRRIGRLMAIFKVKSNCSDEEFKKMVRAGEACPIRKSLHPEIELNEDFVHIK